MMCTNMTTILSHQEDLGPSMLAVKYEGLGSAGVVTTPLNMAPNLSECNVSHGGIAPLLVAVLPWFFSPFWFLLNISPKLVGVQVVAVPMSRC